MFWTQDMFQAIHRASFENGDGVVGVSPAKWCGCFHCQAMFTTDELTEEHLHLERSGKSTILCPRCGIDSVLVESPELTLEDGFLELLHDRYF